ncbi:MAG TPA: hypothetical protein EYG71_08065 [Leucothrix sp.]|nr:hypothetical protein [Leucothrix sp.]
MRIEHVWVEAATDFQPSRGAINQDADTWLQLDPSFKQYEYQEGLDVVAISGLDMDQLAQDFVDSGTVNEAEGWATGFDPSILQSAQTQAQEKLEAHIATLDNPTVGDVIGGKKTIIKEYPALPSSLPNRIVIVGTRYDKLPSALQQKIEFAFNKDILGDMIDPITFPFAKLNNEKVNLSFKPATQADEDALAALIPDGITDVNELPTSIPNSIRVIPELKVNGEVVKTGASMGLGEELPFVTGIRFAGKGYVRTPREYKVVAGSFLNVNVFAGSVSRVKMEKLYTKLEETKNILASGDELEIASLTKDEVLGDIFYAGSSGYYSQLIALAHIKAKYTNNFFQLATGYGTIGYEPRVNSFFGQPRGIRNGGIVFDIPMIQVVANSDGDLDLAKQFTMSVGVESSTLEHVIPEQMFAPSDPNEPRLDGISAVKALQKAGLEGQKIYLITKDNMNQIMPLINFDTETRNEVTRALSAGKRVTAHPDKVSVPGGWSGFGYIINDPVVGDGVYKISGGANGSDVNLGDLTGVFTTMGVAGDMKGFANLSRLSSIFSGIMSFFTLSEKGCDTITSVIGGIISTALNSSGSTAIAGIGFSSMIPLLQIIFWVVLLSVILIALTMLINDLIGLTCSVMIKIKRLKKLIPSNIEAGVFV